eukprot:TRINITY_DN30045_c0_g1_i1.p1 TRINITY_DN30045_c0_g1~~TRINITY_DN30045_c0_g1_i1.p1  ORF type:complete len:149 (-),score=14.55 TRINITY_DN30045_c0_g1_i1:9-455(-)
MCDSALVGGGLEAIVEIVVLLIIILTIVLMGIICLGHDVHVVAAGRASVTAEDGLIDSLVLNVEVELLATVVINASIGLAVGDHNVATTLRSTRATFLFIWYTLWKLLVPHRRESTCLLYTSDAADEEDSVDLGGRRIIKKKISRQNE